MSMIIQPARFGLVGISDATWMDPDQTPASITLSNGNLTVKKTAAGKAHSVGRHGKATGKWRFQARIDDFVAHEFSIGLSSARFNRTEWLGNDGQGVGYVSDGRTGYNGGAPGNGLGAMVDGDIVDVYVDCDAKRCWFGRNGTISGNPTAGTGGYDISGMPRCYYPDIGMDSLDNQVTFNFAGPFSHNLHPAYQPWSRGKVATKAQFRAAMIYIRNTGWYGHALAELILSTASNGANLLAGATGTAGSTYQTYVPGNAFDGNEATEWTGTPGGGSAQIPTWLAGDSGANDKAAEFLSIIGNTSRGSGSQDQIPTFFDLYLSPDAVVWDKAAIGMTFPAWPYLTVAPYTTKRELALPAYD